MSVEGYEMVVNADLNIKGNIEVYDRTKWRINKGRMEWIGGRCEQDLERYLEELVEDVFNAKAEIGGRVGWEGEDREDYGYYEVDGKKVECNFQKNM